MSELDRMDDGGVILVGEEEDRHLHIFEDYWEDIYQLASGIEFFPDYSTGIVADYVGQFLSEGYSPEEVRDFLRQF